MENSQAEGAIEELKTAKRALARELIIHFPDHKIRSIKIMRATFPSISLVEAKELLEEFMSCSG